MTSTDFLLLLPALILTAGASVLLLVPLFTGTSGRAAHLLAFGTVAGSILAVLLTPPATTTLSTIVSHMLAGDAYARFFQSLLLLTFAAVIALSMRYLDEGGYSAWEYHALLMFAAAGCWFMVASVHFVSMYISLELLSVCSYVLAGYYKREQRSTEAAVKYFVLGAVSSAILLYGVSLVYGATGSLRFSLITAGLERGGIVAVTGVLMVAAGLFFKIAAAPFHVWTPDVYAGAPTPVTAFLSTASKIAAVALLGRLFLSVFAPVRLEWSLTVAAVAALSMIVGNVAALTQNNLKRMLAYSSVGQAGYLLLAIVATSPIALRGLLVYSVVYIVALLGVWSIILTYGSDVYGAEAVDDLQGLHRRAPFAAFMMLVFLLSLGGLPPTGGFIGKYFLFSAAVQSGFGWLAVLAVLTSALSMFYYLRIVLAMYLREGSPSAVPSDRPLQHLAVICLIVTLAAGVFPQPLLRAVDSASTLLAASR